MGSSGASSTPASPVQLTTVAAGVVLANSLAAGDANPAFEILGDGTIKWGPGGAGALDTALFRVGVDSLRMDGSLQAAAGIVTDTVANYGAGHFTVNHNGGLWSPNGILADVIANYAAGFLNVSHNGGLHITALGAGLQIKEGANCRMGRGTLIGGTLTIANTTITAATEVFVTDRTAAAANVGSIGEDSASRIVGTSFTIKSTNALDTSSFCWLLLEPS